MEGNKPKIESGKFKQFWDTYWSNHKTNTEINKITNQFVNDFNEIMTEIGLYTTSYKTFKLQRVIYKPYGFICQIYTAKGLNFTQLEEAVTCIEDGIGCTFIVKRIKRKPYIWATIVIDDVVKDIKYNPQDLYVEEKEIITEVEKQELMKKNFPDITIEEEEENGTTVVYKVRKRKYIKPYEFFLGYDASGKPVVINMVHYAHLLATGATRSGKSKLLDCILTSLIYFNEPKNLQLFLIQIAKDDLALYAKYKQVCGYAETLEQAVELLEYIVDVVMEERRRMIRPMHVRGLGNNILEYNKRYPEKPMSFIHVVFDEMASLIDCEGEDEEIKKLKKKIIKNVDKITQYGGSLGVNCVNSLQRATHDKLPPFAKSNCNLVVSFRQNNSKSSEVAIGDPQLAVGLEQREIVFRASDYDFAKVPLITDRLVVETLKKWEDYNHPMYEFKGLDKKGKNKNKQKNTDNEEDEKTIRQQNAEIKREENANEVIKASMEMMQKFAESIAVTMQSNVKEKEISNIKTEFPKVTPIYDKVNEVVITKSSYEKNISKIDGFVPFNPSPKANVIDQTKFDPSKTTKPIKIKKE